MSHAGRSGRSSIVRIHVLTQSAHWPDFRWGNTFSRRRPSKIRSLLGAPNVQCLYLCRRRTSSLTEAAR